jgi:transposase InsO family protein
VVKLAGRYGRYGYRRVTALLRTEGWPVNHKRVERIWRQEGLKVPKKQPKRGRLWLNDGSCVRLRPTHRGHVWSYDFTAARTHDGRPLRMLTVLDEYTRECLAIVVDRKLKSDDVLHTLAKLFVEHGAPEHLRSDNGPEFTAKVVRTWLKRLGVRTLFIEPGSPWENGYNESFNGAGARGAVAQGVQYDPAAQFAGLQTARSADGSARRILAQTACVARAADGGGTCCRTNLTRGTTLGGRSDPSGCLTLGLMTNVLSCLVICIRRSEWMMNGR